MNFTPAVYEHAAKLIGVTPWQASRCRDLVVAGHAEAYRRYHHTPILTGIAPTMYINDRQWQIGYYDRHMALNVFDGENRVRITRFQLPELPPGTEARK